jgi:hypothetical protein
MSWIMLIFAGVLVWLLPLRACLLADIDLLAEGQTTSR